MWLKNRRIQRLGGGRMERFGLRLWSRLQFAALRQLAGNNLPRSARVSDPVETADRRSPAILETFGRRAGSVRDRPQRCG